MQIPWSGAIGLCWDHHRQINTLSFSFALPPSKVSIETVLVLRKKTLSKPCLYIIVIPCMRIRLSAKARHKSDPHKPSAKAPVGSNPNRFPTSDCLDCIPINRLSNPVRPEFPSFLRHVSAKRRFRPALVPEAF